MADNKVTGSVSVEVVPDARLWEARLKAQILGDSEKAGAEYGKKFGDAAGKAVGDGVADGVKKSSDKASRDSVKQGAEVGGKFAAALKQRLEVALRNLPQVKLTADSDAVQRQLALLRTELQRLKDAKIGVDLNASDALAKARLLETRLRELSASDVDIQTRFDAAAAAAEMAAFSAAIDRLDGREVDVKVDADTTAARANLDSMGASGNIASGRILGLVSAIALIGPAAGPVAAVAVGGLMAIAAAATAAAAGVGVLVLALAPVIGATQAVVQAQSRQATTASQAASRALGLASAQDALAAALRGVRSAQLDAAAATENSSRRVADAKQRIIDAARDSAQAIARASRSIVSAERDVADSQRDAKKAQDDLAAARRQYAQDQEDLASRLANGALDEREAQLRLAEAQQDLLKAKADPRVSELERAKAQLAVDQAVQGLRDQQVENRRLSEEKAKADREGVDGSDAVKSAQERLADATRRVEDAQQRLADASEARARVQEDAARSVADAQRDLRDAERDAADQARRSGEQIVAAKQAVVNAQRGVEQASQRAASVGGATQEAMRQKLAALAPEGRKFVDFLVKEMIPEWQRLSRVGQSAFLPGLQDGMQSMIAIGPDFDRVIRSVGGTLGDLARQAGLALGGPFWRDFYAFAAREFPPALRVLGEIFGNLAEASAGLIIAFDPINDKVLGAVADLSARLRDLATDTDPDSPIQRFVAWLSENGPIVWQAIEDIATGVFDLVVALAPLGVSVASGLGAFAKAIGDLPPPVIQGVALAIGALAGAFAVMNASQAITRVAAMLGRGGPWVLGITALGAAAVVAYNNFEPFRRSVDAVWAALKRAGDEVKRVTQPAFDTLASATESDLVPALEQFLDAATPIVTLLIDSLGPAIAVLVQNNLTSLLVIVETVSGALEVLASGLGLVSGFLPGVGSESGKAGTNLASLRSSADTAATSTGKLADESKRAAEAARELAAEAFASRDAEERYEAALDSAAEAIKRNGATLDVHTEKGRANRDALDEVTKAANDQLEQLGKNGAGETEIQKKYDASRAALIKVATQMGMNKQDAKRYADQLLLTPKNISTQITTPGAVVAKAQAENVRSSLKDLASQSTTTRTQVTSNWEKIRDLAKAPIRFLINTVLGGGFVSTFNSISSKIGGPTIPMPKAAFAAGGVMPGYTPGRDVHEFFSPTAGFLALSGGEAVMRPEFTRAVGGKAGVDQLNKMAQAGVPLVELFGGANYAAGGVLDFIKSKAASTWDWVTDTTSDLYRKATNPAAALGGFTIPGGGGVFRDLAASAGSAIKSAMVEKLTSLWGSFKSAFSESGIGGFPPGGGIGMGYSAMVNWIRKYLPGVQITSTYRPNAVTSSGNTSYHAMGRAVDMAPSMDTFNKIKASYGSSIRELIYSPAGNAQIKNGQPYYYTGAVRDAHFCVPTDVEILTKRGWLTLDQVVVGVDETLGLNFETGQTEWTPILDVNRFADAEVFESANHGWKVQSTLGHRWITSDPKTGQLGWTTTGQTKKGRPWLVAAPMEDASEELPITLDEAELLGWLLTDGSMWRSDAKCGFSGCENGVVGHGLCNSHGRQKRKGQPLRPLRAYPRRAKEQLHLFAWQSKPGSTARLAEILGDNASANGKGFRVKEAYARDLLNRYGLSDIKDGAQLLAAACKMSAKQREAMLTGVVGGDGHVDRRGAIRIYQDAGPLADFIATLAYLCGYRVNVWDRSHDFKDGRKRNGANLVMTLGKARAGTYRQGLTSLGRMDVWCPTTGNGSWTARFGQNPTLTGNSHVHWAMRDGGVIPTTATKYDEGGWIPTGLTTVLNGTGRPEPVLTGSQWDDVRAGGGGITIGELTVQIPMAAGTLDMMSPVDRQRAARAIHDELQKIKAGRS